MPRSEKALWAYIRPRLKRYGLLERIENMVGYGTPDVNYCLTWQGTTCEGWLELKEMDNWPGDPEAIFRVDHYTQQQRLWHRIGWARGRAVFVLLRIRKTDEIMVIPGSLASARLGRVPKAGLIEASVISDGRSFPTPDQLKELIKRLGRPAIPYDPRMLLPEPE